MVDMVHTGLCVGATYQVARPPLNERSEDREIMAIFASQFLVSDSLVGKTYHHVLQIW